MPIQGTTPYVVPEQTYDHYWMINLNVQAPDPSRAVAVNVTLRPYRVVDPEYGTTELAATGAVRFSIPDLFAAAATDPELATVVEALLNKVQAMAVAKGLI